MTALLPWKSRAWRWSVCILSPDGTLLISWEHAQMGNTMFWLIFYFDLSQRQTITNDP